MVLSGHEIIKSVSNGDIKISPFDLKRVGPNSYDLELGSKLYVYKQYNLDVSQDHRNDLELVDLIQGGWFLEPGTIYLAHTLEWTETDKFVPMVEGRSSIGRLGIRIHATAGFGDVGFKGQWTLEIDVVQPIKLIPGIRICQIYWHSIQGVIDHLYKGKYAGAKGVMASKLFEDR